MPRIFKKHEDTSQYGCSRVERRNIARDVEVGVYWW